MQTDRFRSQQACRAVEREFEMYSAVVRALETVSGPESDSHVNQALLDSLLLHTRVLRDFFFHEGHRSEELVAAHFVSNWKLLRPATAPYLFAHKRRLDQHLGRLTVKKVRASDDWNIAAIRAEVEPLIELFLSLLPADLQTQFYGPFEPTNRP